MTSKSGCFGSGNRSVVWGGTVFCVEWDDVVRGVWQCGALVWTICRGVKECVFGGGR